MDQPLPRREPPDFGSRVPPRQPVFNIPSIVVALIALNVGVHLLRSYGLNADSDLGLILRTAFIPLRYSGDYVIDLYAFTSPLTYSLLHGGFAHLAINMIWLAAFGSPLANRMGVVRFLAFWCVTAVAAAGLHYVLHPLDPSPLVGASGAISGMMGGAARFGFRVDRSDGRSIFAGRILSVAGALSSRVVLVFLAVWLAANLLAGYGMIGVGGDNPIAWEAHIGGFLAGFLLTGLFVPRRPAPFD